MARHWLAGGSPAEAAPWLLAAARDALRLGAFADALQHLAPVLDYAGHDAEALRLRAEALDALGDPAAVAAYRHAAQAAGEPESHNLLAKGALAQVMGFLAVTLAAVIQKRIDALPKPMQDLGWKAQVRLCKRFRRLTARGKHPNVAVTAIARELTGFVWAIAQEVSPASS